MIEALISGFGTALMWMGGVAMLALAAAAIAINVRRLTRNVRPSVRGASAVALAVLGVAGVLYGGRKGRITYPYTDWEMRYLLDAGSYVTNDFVHVNFTRIVAPATAPFYISFRPVDSTNDLDWVDYTNTTFAAFSVPADIPYPAATNYDWICYTTWTPGPSVQTNGVWHSYWGLDRKLHIHFVPIRSAIRVDGETIATPKSKRVAAEAEEEEEE